MSDAWMSIIEYARRYNVSDMTVRRRIKTGRLSAELRDGKYYIAVRDSSAFSREKKEPMHYAPPSPPVEMEQPFLRTRSSESIQNPRRRFFYQDDSEVQAPHFHNEGTNYPNRQAVPIQEPIHEDASDMNHAVELCETMLEKLMVGEEQLKTSFQVERDLFKEKVKSLEIEIKNKEDLHSEKIKILELELKNKEDLQNEKIKYLEHELNNKEEEIARLKSSVEDLEVLIKLLDEEKNQDEVSP